MEYQAFLIKHRGEYRIAVKFEKKREYIERIKKLDGAMWSATKSYWHLPDTDAYRERFGLEPRFVFNQNHQLRVREFNRWMSPERFSPRTNKTYTDALVTFLSYFNTKAIEDFVPQDLIDFNNDYILKNKLSSSYQNQITSAVKLFFFSIGHQKFDIDLVRRPKKEKTIPNVLSMEEVKMILNAHSNTKHRMMLQLIYSCGLRRGELLNLKPLDIESQRGVIRIRQAKGKKDRIVKLSEKILPLLRAYYIQYKPKVWLFEGQTPGEPYDERSLNEVMKQALAKTSIKKPATLHWLRHSYATHLLENGTDLRYIQELLGHKSSRTTEIYTHVSTKNIKNIRSPFDDL